MNREEPWLPNDISSNDEVRFFQFGMQTYWYQKIPVDCSCCSCTMNALPQYVPGYGTDVSPPKKYAAYAACQKNRDERRSRCRPQGAPVQVHIQPRFGASTDGKSFRAKEPRQIRKRGSRALEEEEKRREEEREKDNDIKPSHDDTREEREQEEREQEAERVEEAEREREDKHEIILSHESEEEEEYTSQEEEHRRIHDVIWQRQHPPMLPDELVKFNMRLREYLRARRSNGIKKILLNN